MTAEPTEALDRVKLFAIVPGWGDKPCALCTDAEDGETFSAAGFMVIALTESAKIGTVCPSCAQQYAPKLATLVYLAGELDLYGLSASEDYEPLEDVAHWIDTEAFLKLLHERAEKAHQDWLHLKERIGGVTVSDPEAVS